MRFQSITEHLALENQSVPPPIELIHPQLNPLIDDGVTIFAQEMAGVALNNIKSLVAFKMLEEASEAGQLQGIHTVVEASSGNTGYSLAMYAPFFGIGTTIILVPADIAPGKLEMLRLAHAKIRTFGKGESGIGIAKEMGQQPGHLNLNQYGNYANVRAHLQLTAPHIYDVIGDKLTVFFSGIGTGGSVLGCLDYFEEQGATHILVGGVLCAPGEDQVPGVRTYDKLRDVTLPWQRIKHLEEVKARDSYRLSMRLTRQGIAAGPSSGFALAGLLQFLQRRRDEGTLDELRNADDQVVAAFLCPDTAFPYLDKYSTHLNPEDDDY